MTKEDQILNGIQEIKINLAEYKVYQKQQRKEIDFITKKVESHEKNQNKFFGWISALGILLTAFFSWLFKQF
jgi:hypothetical protein